MNIYAIRFAAGLCCLLVGAGVGMAAFGWSEYLKVVSGFDAASQAPVAAMLVLAAAAGGGIGAARGFAGSRSVLLVSAAALAVVALISVYFNDLVFFVHEALAAAGSGTIGRLVAFLVPVSVQVLLVAAAVVASSCHVAFGFGHESERGGIMAGYLFLLTLGLCAGFFVGLMSALFLGVLQLPFLAGCILAAAGLVCWVAHHRLDAAAAEAEPAGAFDWLPIGAAAVSMLSFLGAFPVWQRMLANAFGPLSAIHALGVIAAIGAFAWGMRSGLRKKDAAAPVVIGRALLLLAMALLAGLFLQGWLAAIAADIRWHLWGEPLDTARAFQYMFAAAAIQFLFVLLPAFCAGLCLTTALREIAGKAGVAAAGQAAGAALAAGGIGLLLCPLLLSAGNLWTAQATVAAVALAAALAVIFRSEAARRIQGSALAAAAVVAVLIHAAPDARAVSGGHYIGGRQEGQPLFSNRIRQYYHADGLAASISVLGTDDLRGVNYNGVPTGLVRAYVPSQPDTNLSGVELLDSLSALLPATRATRAGRAAVVGVGSGLVPAVLLGRSSLTEVHTVEIEARAIDAVAELGPQVAPALEDSRSRMHNSVPAVFFDAQPADSFDMIVVNYSKPWVAGWSGFFTYEHFARMRRALADGGYLVQKIDLEYTYVEDTARIMMALIAHFPEYEVFLAEKTLIVVAGGGRRPGDLLASDQGLAAAAARVGISSVADLQVFRLGDHRLFSPLFESYGLAGAEDRLFLFAGRAFASFVRGSYNPMIDLRKLDNWIFSNDILPGTVPVSGHEGDLRSTGRQMALSALAARDGDEFVRMLDAAVEQAKGGKRFRFPDTCRDREDEANFIVALEERAAFVESFLRHEERPELWRKISEHLPCYRKVAAEPELGNFFTFWEGFSRQDYRAALISGSGIIIGRKLLAYTDPDARIVLRTMLAAYAQGEYLIMPQIASALAPQAHDRFHLASRMILAQAILRHEEQGGAAEDLAGQ